MGEAFRHPEITGLLQGPASESPLASGTVERSCERAVDRGELAPVRLPSASSGCRWTWSAPRRSPAAAPVAEKTIVELVDDVYLPLLRGLAHEK